MYTNLMMFHHTVIPSLPFSQISSFDTVLKGIDSSTGIAKCLYVISRLDYLHDEQVKCECSDQL